MAQEGKQRKAGKEMGPRGRPDLVWEDPAPPKSVVAAKYGSVIAEVREHPGRWARIVVMGRGNVYGVKKRLQDNLSQNDKRWETAVRRIPFGEGEDAYGIYLRYRNDEQMKESEQAT